MSDNEAKPEEGNEPITIRVKDQTGEFCISMYILVKFIGFFGCTIFEMIHHT